MWKPSRLARNGFCWRECTIILLIVLGFCYVYWDPDPSRTPPLKGDDTVISGPTPIYAFTLSVIPRRVKYLCLVLDSLWQQTVPPRDVFIFHGPEVTDLPDCGAHNPYSSFMVPDTGPGIKLRHLLRAQNGTGPSLGPTLPVGWDVIVVDDDSIMHPELAQTLLLAKRRYPGSVIVNDAYEVYEFYRVTVYAMPLYAISDFFYANINTLVDGVPKGILYQEKCSGAWNGGIIRNAFMMMMCGLAT